MTGSEPPLIVITGPTASGKSSIAMYLAQKYDGEIICADSRTIYQGLNVGTAKPNEEDQRLVKHWLLDVVAPDERFTVADFQSMATQAIVDIRRRGKIPFLVGGTGLYIDSVVLDYQFGPIADPVARRRYEVLSEEELITMLKKLHIPLPVNVHNKRHLIRAIEQKTINQSRRASIIDNTVVVAISTDKEVIEQRIRSRAEEIFYSDVVNEASKIAQKYGWENESMTGNIYPIIRQYLEGKLSIEQAKEWFVIRDRQLVKKQLTWFKRHNFVQWYDLTDARDYIDNLLNQYRLSEECDRIVLSNDG